MAPIVAALLDSAAARASLRRSLSRQQARITNCRSPKSLWQCVASSMVDAVVVGPKAIQGTGVGEFRSRVRGVPTVVFGAIRPDDVGSLMALATWCSGLIVEGVDDPVLGDLVIGSGYLAARRAALADLPRMLRLTEPIQKNALEVVLANVGSAPSTEDIANRLETSREHLSRQFGAGGAPNLKRVVDMVQVITARDYLADRGFPPSVVSELLGYCSIRQLATVVRRVSRLSLGELARVNRAEVVRRFAASGARSRR